jgi:hypothetical protein
MPVNVFAVLAKRAGQVHLHFTSNPETVPARSRLRGLEARFWIASGLPSSLVV